MLDRKGIIGVVIPAIILVVYLYYNTQEMSKQAAARARAMAATIATMAPLAIEGVLEAVEHGSSMEDGLLSEAHIFGRLCGTEDKREGLTAFLEKRKPTWTGR